MFILSFQCLLAKYLVQPSASLYLGLHSFSPPGSQLHTSVASVACYLVNFFCVTASCLWACFKSPPPCPDCITTGRSKLPWVSASSLQSCLRRDCGARCGQTQESQTRLMSFCSFLFLPGPNNITCPLMSPDLIADSSGLRTQ